MLFNVINVIYLYLCAAMSLQDVFPFYITLIYAATTMIITCLVFLLVGDKAKKVLMYVFMYI